MLADFWTMHPGGTWPAAATLFYIVLAILGTRSYMKYRAKKSHEHYHQDERGVLVKCYHYCKETDFLFSWRYWMAFSTGFIVEHVAFHKFFILDNISHWLNIQ